jgi:hypothetical protein
VPYGTVLSRGTLSQALRARLRSVSSLRDAAPLSGQNLPTRPSVNVQTSEALRAWLRSRCPSGQKPSAHRSASHYPGAYGGCKPGLNSSAPSGNRTFQPPLTSCHSALGFRRRAERGRFASPTVARGLKFLRILPIESSMTHNYPGRVTLGDLRPQGLLDLYRQGTTWVAAIRLRDGRLTNLALEESVTTRKAALQFLQIELSKFAQSPMPR